MIAPGRSVTTGRASITSNTRITLARASWPSVTRAVRNRTGPTIATRYDENARNVPRVISPRRASQPPSASTPTWPNAGIACSAGLYLAIRRTVRTRDAYRSPLAASRCSVSCSSWPKPLTTRTPVTAASTTPATSAARCWASQLAGNSRRRDASEMNHKDGPTASAMRVSSGDSTAMAISAPANSTALPSSSGTQDTRLCTMVRSDIDRLTTWPVCSSSWRVPSSRDSEPISSVRMSCWTSRESLPPR